MGEWAHAVPATTVSRVLMTRAMQTAFNEVMVDAVLAGTDSVVDSVNVVQLAHAHT